MLQVKILNPKAKRILDELASLNLITIREEGDAFPLTPGQKESIEISRKQIQKGQFRKSKEVFSDLRKWAKSK